MYYRDANRDIQKPLLSLYLYLYLSLSLQSSRRQRVSLRLTKEEGSVRDHLGKLYWFRIPFLIHLCSSFLFFYFYFSPLFLGFISRIATAFFTVLTKLPRLSIHCVRWPVDISQRGVENTGGLRSNFIHQRRLQPMIHSLDRHVAISERSWLSLKK